VRAVAGAVRIMGSICKADVNLLIQWLRRVVLCCDCQHVRAVFCSLETTRVVVSLCLCHAHTCTFDALVFIPPLYLLHCVCACRSRWFVTSSIIGATSLDQLKENLEAFSITLPAEAFDDINAIYRKYRDPPTSA